MGYIILAIVLWFTTDLAIVIITDKSKAGRYIDYYTDTEANGIRVGTILIGFVFWPMLAVYWVWRFIDKVLDIRIR